jgi:peroxiredoxin
MFFRVFCAAALGAALMFASGELSNRRAPGFALPDLGYTHTYDLQDYRGRVVVIDIMSTTCPHCMLMSTALEQVKSKYGDKVQALSVVLPPDTADTVAKYIKTNNVTVPILYDQGQMTISYFNAKPGQSQISVPHIFLIDKQGMIRNDFQYDEKSKSVFEGPGLFAEIDKLLK